MSSNPNKTPIVVGLMEMGLSRRCSHPAPQLNRPARPSSSISGSTVLSIRAADVLVVLGVCSGREIPALGVLGMHMADAIPVTGPAAGRREHSGHPHREAVWHRCRNRNTYRPPAWSHPRALPAPDRHPRIREVRLAVPCGSPRGAGIPRARALVHRADLGRRRYRISSLTTVAQSLGLAVLAELVYGVCCGWRWCTAPTSMSHHHSGDYAPHNVPTQVFSIRCCCFATGFTCAGAPMCVSPVDANISYGD